MTYRERRMRRVERLRRWAETRETKAESADRRFHAIADHIPLGQPILVGHHSERHHRRDVARMDAALHAAHEHRTKAADMRGRADSIEQQAARAIYSDDPDAVEQLRARIATLEAERERVKAINAAIRKGPGWEHRITPPLTPSEREDLIRLATFCTWHDVARKGYPAYHLRNLAGNIARQRQRLADLEARARAAATLAAEQE